MKPRGIELDPAPVLVIGWGSDLRGDDVVGREVACRLAAASEPGVRVIATHQPGPELAEDIARSSRVVFVDAWDGAASDSVQVLPMAAASTSRPGGLGHAGGPDHLLALARDVYGAEPEAWMVAVPVHRLDLGETMSAPAQAALEEAVAAARSLIRAPTDGKRRSEHV